MSPRKRGIYLIKWPLIQKFIEEDKSIVKFAQYCGVNPTRLQNSRNQMTGLTWEEVIQIASYVGFTADKICELKPKQRNAGSTVKSTKENVVDEFSESEKLLDGLKAKIAKRLSTTHSSVFINEITDTVNDIIIEAAYLGVIASKIGRSKFIENAMLKRRR